MCRGTAPADTPSPEPKPAGRPLCVSRPPCRRVCNPLLRKETYAWQSLEGFQEPAGCDGPLASCQAAMPAKMAAATQARRVAPCMPLLDRQATLAAAVMCPLRLAVHTTGLTTIC